jgi:hypothetical protein
MVAPQRRIEVTVMRTILLAAALCLGLALPASAGAVTPLAANQFGDSVGVNVHMSYWHWAYGDRDATLARLRQIGIRHVRDGLNPWEPYLPGALDYLGDNGIKLDLIVGHTRVGSGGTLTIDDDPATTVDMISRNISGVVAVEGLNESDHGFAGDWWNVIRDHQARLWEAANGRYTVVAPSLVHPDWWCGDQVLGCPAGTWYDLSQFADRANMHNYPGGAAPKAGTEYGGIAYNMNLAHRSAPEAAVWSTEYGHHSNQGCRLLEPNCWGHPPAPRSRSHAWLIAALLEHLRQGVDRTYLYELVDGWSDGVEEGNIDCCFGLFESVARGDGTYRFGAIKPAGATLRNWLALLADNGTVTPGDLEYTVKDPQQRLNSMLFEKSDGTRWIALWQTEGDTSSRTVTLTLESAQAMSLYRPSTTQRPVTAWAPTTTARLSVGSDPVLIRVG